MSHQRRWDDALFRHDFIPGKVNPINHVVVTIGDEKRVAVSGQEVGSAPAHGLAVVRWRANQQPGLEPADNLGRVVADRLPEAVEILNVFLQGQDRNPLSECEKWIP